MFGELFVRVWSYKHRMQDLPAGSDTAGVRTATELDGIQETADTEKLVQERKTDELGILR